jgi:hypothetical protein
MGKQKADEFLSLFKQGLEAHGQVILFLGSVGGKPKNRK